MNKWWSITVRIVCLLNGKAADCKSLQMTHLVKAIDWDQAFEKALEIGKSHEETYRGAEGHDVEWRFTEIITIDCLGNAITDGMEVYSEPIDLSNLSDEENLADPRESQPVSSLG